MYKTSKYYVKKVLCLGRKENQIIVMYYG